MKRWEFDSVAQAARCISSWFTGTHTERFLFKEHLYSEIGIVKILLHLDTKTCRILLCEIFYSFAAAHACIYDILQNKQNACLI